ncbi:MAG: NRDE family protein [Woeseiaceae bacterium]
MCLIVFAWRAHPEFRLIVAANRDEYHARPARAAHWWPDRRQLFGGRDLQAGGTWLAVSRNGRFAAVTNYREQQRPGPGQRSRGELVAAFVDGTLAPGDFARSVDGQRYAGYCLLLSDGDRLVYTSNRDAAPVELGAGVYGLANAALDTPWHKVLRARSRLASLIETGQPSETGLLRLLDDREPAPVDAVEESPLPFGLARALSAPFVVAEDYGTRCSTTLLWREQDIAVCERRFDTSGRDVGTTRVRFPVASGPAQSASAEARS